MRLLPPNFRRRIAVPLAALVGSLACSSSLIAELEGPKPNDRNVTLVVSSLMKRQHLLRHPLDDEISRRGLTQFLKTLDPMKMYFLQADVDEFQTHQDELDDQIKRGDIKLAYSIFNVFLKRVHERVAAVDELLKLTHDFEIREDFATDPETFQNSASSEEATERWRKRIKYDLLALKSDKTEGEKAIEKLSRRYQSFEKRMLQTNSDQLLEMYLTSFTTGFDPHTTYMSPSTLENFRIIMRLELEGIGAALRVIDGYTEVSKIIPGGAADRDGKLKVEDRIVSVGQGADGKMVEVVDMQLSNVVKLIRGKAGTVVRLGVRGASGGDTQIYNITRDKIKLEDSAARSVIFEDGKKTNGNPYKVGVIDLPSFYMDMEAARRNEKDYRSTTRDVRKILDDFTKKKVDAVILDLRRNGGGSLNEAISMTGLFIDRGPVVQIKDALDRVQKYEDTERGMAWDGPLVILTSKFSASASEILAGAIQDYRRGLVVGDATTHGKGTVQSLLDLGQQLFRIPNPPNLGALKITMQQYYRPNGHSTQKRGVLADVVLPSISTHMDVGESDLDYPIDFDKIDPVAHQQYELVAPETLQALRKTSLARRQTSEDFDRLLKNIERYRKFKKEKLVSLHGETFFAQRAELNAEKEEEKQFDAQANGNEKPTEEVVKRDYYFNEVLAITIDYIQQLSARNKAVSN
ncbi:MAG: tail-specific protease [Planctomycetaceae bacterium]|nr:tail-specific protease [Planctomycetaceae bacterium]